MEVVECALVTGADVEVIVPVDVNFVLEDFVAEVVVGSLAVITRRMYLLLDGSNGCVRLLKKLMRRIVKTANHTLSFYRDLNRFFTTRSKSLAISCTLNLDISSIPTVTV